MFKLNNSDLLTVAIALLMSTTFLGGTLVVLDSISPLLTNIPIESQQLA